MNTINNLRKNSKPGHIRHCIGKSESGASLLVVEVMNDAERGSLLPVSRLLVSDKGELRLQDGVRLASKHDREINVLNVQTGDVIVIGNEYYRLGDSLEKIAVLAIDDENLRTLVASSPPVILPQPAIDNPVGVALFAGEWPEWVESSLKDQIEIWKERNFQAVVEVAPLRLTDAEIQSACDGFPYFALKHLKERLTAQQLQSCIERSPEGAIRFCLDAIDPSEFVHEHADILLENANQLDQNTLDICAMYAPEEAMLLASNLLSDKALATAACGVAVFEGLRLLEQYPKAAARILSSMTTMLPIWKSFFDYSGPDWVHWLLEHGKPDAVIAILKLPDPPEGWLQAVREILDDSEPDLVEAYHHACSYQI